MDCNNGIKNASLSMGEIDEPMDSHKEEHGVEPTDVSNASENANSSKDPPIVGKKRSCTPGIENAYACMMSIDEPMNFQKEEQGIETENVNNSKGPPIVGKKRSCTPDLEPMVKRLKKNGFPTSSASQTPLALLNELRPGLNYKIVLSDGPPHCPNFMATVEVDGIVFRGSGNAKKLAKQRAAEAALLTLCPSLVTPPTSAPNNNMDFSQDAPVSGHKTEDDSKKARVEVLVNQAMSGTMNPVMALNEILPGMKYHCIQEATANKAQHSPNPFVFGITLEGNVYKGSGTSKKSAKAAAARAVLLQKFGDLMQSSIMLTPPSGQNLASPLGTFFHPLAANNIAELVISEYNKLMKGNADYVRRKVLAGIVMTSTPDCSGGQLISLGTGTKCISGDHISVKGAVLNDSHAEIISRRGLLRYIYAQLSLHADPETAEKSIFVYNSETKSYCLKPDIKFHLYISTTPCGDARIFSPHDVEGNDGEALDKHPNRHSRGQLRTKLESGEGTVPVKSFESIQTWDGVLQGERLRTMSCSDKVGKWNVVGLQGSLLSHFLDPIYLHSIVIGSLFNPSHLRRALFSRIEDSLEGLPPPYKLNKVLMNTTTSPESRHTGKAPNHSVNWVRGEDGVEVVNAMTGKTLTGTPSRLCKQRLFGKFYGILSQGICSKTGITIKTVPELYVDAKNAADSYKEAKGALMGAFVKGGLGLWKKKPLEQDMFTLDVAL